MRLDLVLALLAASVSASAIPQVPRQAAPACPPEREAAGDGGPGIDGSVINLAVIPTDYGLPFSNDPTNNGPCPSKPGKPDIPCRCPPPRTDPKFLGLLALALKQGFFPSCSIKVTMTLDEFNNGSTEPGSDAQKQRATTMTQVLQSLNNTGPGVLGCPAASYPFIAAQQTTGITGQGSSSGG